MARTTINLRLLLYRSAHYVLDVAGAVVAYRYRVLRSGPDLFFLHRNVTVRGRRAFDCLTRTRTTLRAFYRAITTLPLHVAVMLERSVGFSLFVGL